MSDVNITQFLNEIENLIEKYFFSLNRAERDYLSEKICKFIWKHFENHSKKENYCNLMYIKGYRDN